ncbi:hypothetical protein JOQ06_017734, partial [Pogonophryne albipinna]
MLRLWFFSVGLWLLAPRCGSSPARLYTEEDPLVILSCGSFSPSVTNSSSAWFIQFYSSWCGHCIQYSETWKNLARDVQDWQQAVRVGVLDCAQEENFEVCKEFNIKFYPTFKYFRAHSPETERGTPYRDEDREIQSVRQVMVNILQNHTQQDWPDRCPPLRPYSSVELLPLLGQRSDHYTAIIVEEPDSYVGREVFSQKRLRFFFSSVLRALPGVQRRVSSTAGDQGGALQERESREWRDFSSSQVYAADLESALHYLLRVELATHSSLQGEELQVFKDLVTLVSKLYPGGGSVVKLMETLSDWLVSLPLLRIPYQAVLDLVDNKMRISGVFLGAELRWVGCQGSRAGLRGLQGEAAVLQVMRRYITTFFGCEACGRHFEQAAAESLQTVKSSEQQVLWLWEQHNRVNSRVAGSLSDDPLFPKAPWPSASLCASCHEEKLGVHQWNQDNGDRTERQDRESGQGVRTERQDRESGQGGRTGSQGRETGQGVRTGRQDRETGQGVRAERQDRESGQGPRTGRQDRDPGQIDRTGGQGRETGQRDRTGSQGRETGQGVRAGRQDRESGQGDRTGSQDRESGQGDRTGSQGRETGQEVRAGRQDRESGQGDRTGSQGRETGQGVRTGGQGRETGQRVRTGSQDRGSGQGDRTERQDRKSGQGDRTGSQGRETGQRDRTGSQGR